MTSGAQRVIGGSGLIGSKLVTRHTEFLTVDEKQDIFYENAATFLGLSADEIARHHT